MPTSAAARTASESFVSCTAAIITSKASGNGRRRLLNAVQFADHQHGVDLHGRMIGPGRQFLHEVQHQRVQMVVYIGERRFFFPRSLVRKVFRHAGKLVMFFTSVQRASEYFW